MELQDLRCLVALAQTANFSKAANQLGIAQPSLSQRIKRLESTVGRPLFDRLPGRVVPTAAGHRLVQDALDILARLTDAQRHLCEFDGRIAGPLAIGAIPTLAPFLLPPVLTTLATAHPEVEASVVEDVSDRLIQMVESGELDLAILSTHSGSNTVHVETIASEPLLLLVSREHRLAGGSRATWKDLTGERFLVLHEMHCLSGQVNRVCQRQGVQSPVFMRGAQLATISALVRAGMGVSIVPAMMQAADTHPGCVYLPFAKDPPTREITVAWSLARYRSNAARAMVKLLQRQLKPSK